MYWCTHMPTHGMWGHGGGVGGPLTSNTAPFDTMVLKQATRASTLGLWLAHGNIQAHVVLHTCHAFFAARNWQMGGMHFKKTTEWLLLQLDSTVQAHTTRVDLHLGHGTAQIAQAVTWPP